MPLVNLGFEHRFVPARPDGAGRPPLLLLHGTGGDESDLLPLGEALAPGAALLSPRGKVLENGMPRFFRRLAEGVFDVRDVEARAHELADFVLAARDAYSLAQPVAVGFSNGANIAAALLLLRPEILASAVLFRPMVPVEPAPPATIRSQRLLKRNGCGDCSNGQVRTSRSNGSTRDTDSRASTSRTRSGGWDSSSGFVR